MTASPASASSTFTLSFDYQARLTRRHTERTLLLLAACFLLINTTALALVADASPLIWLHLAVWLACALAGAWLLDRYLPEHDPLLFPLVMFLSGWGLLLIGRLAPPFASRQAAWLLLSVSTMLLIALFPHGLRWLRRYRYSLLVAGLALLVSTILLGQNPSGFGPELWLGFGTVFFQPSEALKVILVAFLASYLGEHYPAMRTEQQLDEQRMVWRSPRVLGPILFMWGLCVVVLVWQQDLGTALLFFAVFLSLLYIASGQIWVLLSGAVLMSLAAVVGYRLFAVVRPRVDIWLNPWPLSDGFGYQVVQSLMAFSAGGIFGEGIGQGSPTYIPVVHSDFVFAALSEEWGLLGVLVLVACLVVLITRGMRLGMVRQTQPFYAFLAVGLSLVIGLQSLLIMGGVLKLLPLTGVTLPFLSYGGSSLLMSFIMVGLLLRISGSERR